MKWIVFIVLVSIMITGCSKVEDEVTTGGSGGGEVMTAQSAEPEMEVVEAEPKSSDKFDHYNPLAWKGRGSALVLCYGSPRMDSCSIEGRPMALHGSTDHGRYVWTVYNKTRLGGTIVCKNGQESYAYEVSGYGGMQYGNCN